MRRFTFKLESVRRLREQDEQRVRVELANALRERGEAQARIDDSRAAEAQLYDYLRQPGRTAAEMAHVARYGTLHRQKIFDQTVLLRQYDKGIELIRTRLATARAKREALDRMYERELAAHVTAARAEEQREIDEIAGMRHARRAAGANARGRTRERRVAA